jgi:anti-sigma factor RsiW
MQDHFARETLKSYVAGRLPTRELLTIDRHVADCPQCASALRASSKQRAAKRLVTSAVHAAAAPHLTYEQMEGYVDGRGAERAQVEAHVAHCALCRRELTEMAAYAPVLAQPLKARPTKPANGLWARLRSWFDSPMRVGALAATVTLAVIGVSESSNGWFTHEPANSGLPGQVSSSHMQAASVERPSFGLYDDSVFAKLEQVSPTALDAYRANDFTGLAALLTEPAHSGNVIAEEALGLLAAQGIGMKADPDTAETLLHQAADGGSRTAQRNLTLLTAGRRAAASAASQVKTP